MILKETLQKVELIEFKNFKERIRAMKKIDKKDKVFILDEKTIMVETSTIL